MAKSDAGTKRKKRGTTDAAPVATADPVEPRLVAFAETLGRIAGTLQGKADAWLDREVLQKQIATVRDGAADLLAQLAGGDAKTPEEKTPASKAAAAKGRSGGVVDAPGKKHRKPPPAGPRAGVEKSQAAKLRTAKTMVKTDKRRGRG